MADRFNDAGLPGVVLMRDQRMPYRDTVERPNAVFDLRTGMPVGRGPTQTRALGWVRITGVWTSGEYTGTLITRPDAAGGQHVIAENVKVKNVPDYALGSPPTSDRQLPLNAVCKVLDHYFDTNGNVGVWISAANVVIDIRCEEGDMIVVKAVIG